MVASPTDSSIGEVRARLAPRLKRPHHSRGNALGGDRLLLIVLALVGIGVVGFSLVRNAIGDGGRGSAVEVGSDAGSGTGPDAGKDPVDEGDDPPAGAAQGAAAASSPAQPIRVHVAGAVAHPGVYALAPGSIGDEAVAAAGGALAEADLGRVNLAGKLVDGQQFYVPHTGEAIPDTGSSGAGDAAASGAGGAGTPGPVNINTAGVGALDDLPGIGATTAQKIVDYRSKHGPFSDVRQLLDVPGIGEGRLAALEGLVTV